MLGAGRGSAWAWAVLAAGEVAWSGWWLTTGSTALFAVGQLLVLAVAALVVVVLRYLRFRRAFERGIALRAVQVERNRLAEDLHDQLGHELSLVALRAGALQVSSTGSAAQLAGELRAQVEEAVVQLRQTVELLRAGPAALPPLEPAAVDVAGLVERARTAGADVAVTGSLELAAPAPVRLTASRVVQEGLTNAARHAPGATVAVGLYQQSEELEVTVRTVGAPRAPASVASRTRGGSGLAALRRRVRAVGGDLSIEQGEDAHLLRARLPFGSAPLGGSAAAGGPAEPGTEPGAGHRRPWRAMLRWALPPVAVVALCVIGFYTWATTGAVVEQRTLDQLEVGEPVAQARPLLPARQAPVRLIPTAPAPPAWTCHLYTDGNVPLGMATVQICDDGTRLTRVEDLREVPWR